MQGSSPGAVPRPHVLWLFVFTAIAAISSASILVRWAQAPPLSIAAYRVTLAALAVGPFFLHAHRSEREDWSKRSLGLSAISGIFLAFHFLFWITSLQKTTVASSVALVSTTPLFVAAFSSLWLRERPHPRLWAGILCTVAGSALVASTDLSLSTNAFAGDILALLGALMAAGYLLTGRTARQKIGISAYAFATYTTAAVVLLLFCILTGAPLSGFSATTYLALILLALVPQLIGHTTFNWILRFLSATVVAVLILGEPIGATLLAWLILGETVSRSSALGLAVLGAGILLSGLTAPSKPSIAVDKQKESK